MTSDINKVKCGQPNTRRLINMEQKELMQEVISKGQEVSQAVEYTRWVLSFAKGLVDLLSVDEAQQGVQKDALEALEKAMNTLKGVSDDTTAIVAKTGVMMNL